MSDQKPTTFLFSVGLDLQSDLENDDLLDGFRQEFEKAKISLSKKVKVIKPKEEGGPWRIRDEDEHHTYLVEKTDEKLNIYSPTDVILVVKGAGLHEAGDTLDLFIQGFWPAVMKLMPKSDSATAPQLAARQEHDILQDYKPPPHIKKEHQHLVEISVRDPSKIGKRKEAVSHRILMKEAYWELGENLPGRWKALFNEWHMATYALRREISNFWRYWVWNSVAKFTDWGLSAWNSVAKFTDWGLSAWNSVKEKMPMSARRSQSGTQTAVDRSAKVVVERLKDEWRERRAVLEFIPIFCSFLVTYFILGLLCLSLILEKTEDLFAFSRRLPPTLFSIVFAATMAVFMSWRPSLRIYHRNTYQEGRLPGLQRWIVIPMIIAFLLDPGTYLLILIIALIPIVIDSISRNCFWDYRKEANTDREFVTYAMIKKGHAERTEKRSFYLLKEPIPIPWMAYYRLVVVLGLPIAFLGLFIAEILIATKILGGFGKTLEAWLNNLFGDKLGDVSAYAMDPARALRIRSAVEYDLRFFHEMEHVDNIHVFAHSQGTPITFETLFTHMPEEYRKKIKTYVTIGSVLGYYYQIAPALDKVSSPGRFRKESYELDTFAKGFRWLNCWNLADNITQFYGLDEYDLELVKVDGDGVKCPTNVKTRLRGHSDYWTNLDEVQIPFARRVLFDEVEDKWKPKTKVSGRILSYKRLVILTTVLLTTIAWHIVALLYPFVQFLVRFGVEKAYNALMEIQIGKVGEETTVGAKAVEIAERVAPFFETLYGTLGWILLVVVGYYIIVQIAKSFWFLKKMGFFNIGWRVRHQKFLDVFLDRKKRNEREEVRPWRIDQKYVQQMVAYVGANWWAHVDPYPYLFSVGLEFVDRLDAGGLVPALRVKFEEQDEVLSSKAKVTVEQAGSKWTIADVGGVYHIKRENLTLNVYADLRWFTDEEKGFGFADADKEKRETMKDNPKDAVDFLKETGVVDKAVIEFYRKRLDFGSGGVNKDEVNSMDQGDRRYMKTIEDRLDREGKEFLAWVKSEWEPTYHDSGKKKRQGRRDETPEESNDSQG